VHRSEPREFEEDAQLRLLATPAWRGEDRLAELLALWCAATDTDTSACLYLLADPRVDGSQEELYARVLGTGIDLESAGDVTVLMEAIDGESDRRLHGSVDAYVPLHGACDGHALLAAAAGDPSLSLDDESLRRFLDATLGVRAGV
jgi:hypothetical protein